MTLTVPPDIEEQITALAKASGRNPKVLAAEALRAYVAREERIVAGIRNGIEAAERGEGIPHEHHGGARCHYSQSGRPPQSGSASVTKVIWTPEVSEALRRAISYIAEDNPYAARRVHEAIKKAGNSLMEFPNRGRHGYVKTTRELVVQGTPYIISYKVIGDTVWILDVIHSAQDRPEDALH